MIISSYGGGLNSTALLIEALRRGLIVDKIFFADTGDERPQTYEYIDYFSEWLKSRGMPAIEKVRWIRRDGSFIPLSTWSLLHKQLPSKAYGYSGCTSKWKQQPLDHRVIHDDDVQWAWAHKKSVERWIGYDADEPKRAERMLEKNPQPPGYELGLTYWTWRCPLVEWDIGREECKEIIQKEGLKVPGKSSCFECPNMKKSEIQTLKRENPDLFKRALEIEANADLKTVKGLGRRFAWKDLDTTDDNEAPDDPMPCGCYDGE